MATVHRAIERGIEGFERVVALKRLLPHLAEDEGFVRAFVREAKLASLLQHGNIVQLYELGRVGSSYFISMEYIPGRDLRVILRQARRVCGPPPVEIALAIMTELLDALDYAHSQCGSDGKPLGLVHRDISPSNLIVSHTGHLKVIDFGIAKATLGHLMTHTGRIKGKLSYMAPEALAGRTLDGRSDLFSASVIAHELLTATPLFAAKDDFQTIDRLQNMQPPPPSARNPTCPPELDDIVLRGLAKDPTQRWRSAAEMRAALAELAIDHHRLATNREVCDWVEEAFEMPLPSRLRMPLTSPSRGHQASHVGPEPKRTTGSHALEQDDEIMDIVWGVTGPRSPMAVVLDEVPDVSARFARVDVEAVGEAGAADSHESNDRMEPIDERDALVGALLMGGEDEPTNAMMRPSFEADDAMEVSPEPRVSFRSGGSQPLSLSSAAAIAERRPDGALVTRSGQSSNGRRVARPSAWALGTSRNPQQPAEDLLEEAVSAGRSRAEALPKPATTTFTGLPSQQQRPSLLPLLLASVAVAGAGAAIAWIVSSGDGDAPSKPAPAASRPVAQSQAQVQPLPAAAPDPLQPQPLAAASPEAALDEVEEEADARSRAQDGRKRAKRAKRDADDRAARAREPGPARDEDRPDRIEDLVPDPTADRPAADRDGDKKTAAAETRPEPAEADPPATKSVSGQDSKDLQPLPVPVTPPSSKEPARARAEPKRPRAAIIVPANRTRREGSMQPIRFPRWEQPPKAITAKLCIDARGTVTSVTVLSPVSAGVRSTVQRALSTWRYRPVVEGDERVAACFATTFRVQVE
jgi:serine/threonine protein kinase